MREYMCFRHLLGGSIIWDVPEVQASPQQPELHRTGVCDGPLVVRTLVVGGAEDKCLYIKQYHNKMVG